MKTQLGNWIIDSGKQIENVLKKQTVIPSEWERSNKKLKELSFEIQKNMDPDWFYRELGILYHDRTRQPVQHLANYQYKVWKQGFIYKYRLVVKSQKVGFTTSALMEDLQRALLPPTNANSTMGHETLIIAQSGTKAKEHLRKLIKMIKQSKKYRDFLITSPPPWLQSTEKTNSGMIFLRNPFDEMEPSRIISLGSNPGSAWSWMNVKHVHMSDPAAINAVDDAELYDAAFSRLAITNGTFLIESPPRGQRGQLWEIYKASKLKTVNTNDPYADEKMEAQFKVYEIPYDYAVQAGVMDEAFFIGERERLGPRFGQYYECEFLNPSNTFYDESLIKYDESQQMRS